MEEILWDLFDPANEPAITLALGFAPIYSVMTGRASPNRRRDEHLLVHHRPARRESGLGGRESMRWSTRKTSTAPTTSAQARPTTAGDPQILPDLYQAHHAQCTANYRLQPLAPRQHHANKARQSRLPALRQQRLAPGHNHCQRRRHRRRRCGRTDPDIFVLRRGTLCIGYGVGPPAARKRSVSSQLAAGTYIIEVYDFDVAGGALNAALHDRFGHGHLDEERAHSKGHDQDEPSSHLSFDRGHRAGRVRIGAGPRVPPQRSKAGQVGHRRRPIRSARMARAVGNGKPGAAVDDPLRLLRQAGRRHADASCRSPSSRTRAWMRWRVVLNGMDGITVAGAQSASFTDGRAARSRTSTPCRCCRTATASSTCRWW